MKVTVFTFFLACSMTCEVAFAQVVPRYLVILKDKANSPFSVTSPKDFLSERAVERRKRQKIAITEHDFPVNPSYLNQIRATGAKVIYSSRWFNGVLLEATDAQLSQIKSLPFYKSVEYDLPLANIGSKATSGLARIGVNFNKLGTEVAIDHGRMDAQLALLGIPEFHKTGFLGQGKLIAVLDGGFSRANQLQFLSAMFQEGRLKETYDFIARDTSVFDDHVHGLHVLSTIAAYQPGTLVGAAPKADFALYRSENTSAETPYEEVTWLLAAERADSLGADIISSSLGYTEFDDEFNTPSYNYTYSDMDGKTTIISRAARFAARKGILVVNSAGNSGNEAWRYITAPADVDSVLSVGSVDLSMRLSAFSSVGPASNGVLKPDVAAVGGGTVIGSTAGTGNVATGSGTSYAAPQISGLAALLWQKYPYLLSQQLMDAIKRSGNQANAPDNFLGYGVPDIQKAAAIIEADYPSTDGDSAVWNHIKLYPSPATTDVYLSIPEIAQLGALTIDLISVTGSTLWTTQQAEGTVISVPLSGISSGLYLVRIRTTERTKTFRFVKY